MGARSFRRRVNASRLNSTGGSTPAPFQSVAADGWRATLASPTDLSLAPVTVTRAGFDATGAATSFLDALYLTKRIFEVYPNETALTSDKQALSDYIYAADIIAGAVNNSIENSPKSVVCWAMSDRHVVGDTLVAELLAFHRDEVACAIFTVSDGVNSPVTATVSGMTISPETTLSGLPVLVYRAVLDISSLADNANVTLNAAVKPRFGVASSVHDSADNAYEARSFSPRTFRRNTSRVANPPLVRIASGGNDTTGYVGIDPALAAASPCATYNGAVLRARAVLGTSAGSLDGLRYQFAEGTWNVPSAPTANTVNAAIVLEPAPGALKANTIFEFGGVSAGSHPAANYIRYSGLTMKRMGVNYLGGNSVHCVVDNCDVDFNGNVGLLVNGGSDIFWVNVAFSGLSGSVISAGNPRMALFRGCTGGTPTSVYNIEPYRLIGCRMSGGGSSFGTRDPSNGVIAFNKLSNMGIGIGATTGASVINGFALIQSVDDFTSATSGTLLRISADGDTADTVHMIMWYVSLAGFNTHGRSNLLYNETSGEPRTHRLQSIKAVSLASLNTKHDEFAGRVSALPDASTRTGGHAFLYGVGCEAIHTQYRDAGGVGFDQNYPGLNASIGTGTTGLGNDPLFTAYAGTTTAGAAGAGNSDLHLQAGSPARGLLSARLLPSDLDGNARPATGDAAGAYA